MHKDGELHSMAPLSSRWLVSTPRRGLTGSKKLPGGSRYAFYLYISRKLRDEGVDYDPFFAMISE